MTDIAKREAEALMRAHTNVMLPTEMAQMMEGSRVEEYLQGQLPKMAETVYALGAFESAWENEIPNLSTQLARGAFETAVKFRKERNLEPFTKDQAKEFLRKRTKLAQEKLQEDLAKSAEEYPQREQFAATFLANSSLFTDLNEDQARAWNQRKSFRPTLPQAAAKLLRDGDIDDEHAAVVGQFLFESMRKPDTAEGPSHEGLATLPPEIKAKVEALAAEDRVAPYGQGYGIAQPIMGTIMGGLEGLQGAASGATFGTDASWARAWEGIKSGWKAGWEGEADFPHSFAQTIRQRMQSDVRQYEQEVADELKPQLADPESNWAKMPKKDLVDYIKREAEVRQYKNSPMVRRMIEGDPEGAEILAEIMDPLSAVAMGGAARGIARGAKAAKLGTRAGQLAAKAAEKSNPVKKLLETFSKNPYAAQAGDLAGEVRSLSMQGVKAGEDALEFYAELSKPLQRYKELSRPAQVELNRIVLGQGGNKAKFLELAKQPRAGSALPQALSQADAAKLLDDFKRYADADWAKRGEVGRNVIVEDVAKNVPTNVERFKESDRLLRDLVRKTGMKRGKAKRIVDRASKGNPFQRAKLNRAMDEATEAGKLTASEFDEYSRVMDEVADMYKGLRVSKHTPKRKWAPNMSGREAAREAAAASVKEGKVKLAGFRQLRSLEADTANLADEFAKHAAKQPHQYRLWEEMKQLTELAKGEGHLHYITSTPRATSKEAAEAAVEFMKKQHGIEFTTIGMEDARPFLEVMGHTDDAAKIFGASDRLVVPKYYKNTIEHLAAVRGTMDSAAIAKLTDLSSTFNSVFSNAVVRSRPDRILYEGPSNAALFATVFGGGAMMKNMGKAVALTAARLADDLGAKSVAAKLTKGMKVSGKFGEASFDDLVEMGKNFGLAEGSTRYDVLRKSMGERGALAQQVTGATRKIADVASLGTSKLVAAQDDAARLLTFVEHMKAMPDLSLKSQRLAAELTSRSSMYMRNMSKFNRGVADIVPFWSFMSQSLELGTYLATHEPQRLGRWMQTINTWRARNGFAPVFDQQALEWDPYASVPSPVSDQPPNYQEAVRSGKLIPGWEKRIEFRVDASPTSWAFGIPHMIDQVLESGDPREALRELPGPGADAMLTFLTGTTPDGQQIPPELYLEHFTENTLAPLLPHLLQSEENLQQLMEVVQEAGEAGADVQGFGTDLWRLWAANTRRTRGFFGEVRPLPGFEDTASRLFTQPFATDVKRSSRDVAYDVLQKMREREQYRKRFGP